MEQIGESLEKIFEEWVDGFKENEEVKNVTWETLGIDSVSMQQIVSILNEQFKHKRITYSQITSPSYNTFKKLISFYE